MHQGLSASRKAYGKYAGTEVTVEGETYLIMRQSDIFAII